MPRHVEIIEFLLNIRLLRRSSSAHDRDIVIANKVKQSIA